MTKNKTLSPILEFRNITVTVGDNKKALDSVTVNIGRGENVAILGPNGAGKSSFIKTLTREYYPEPDRKGSVFRVLGEDVWNIFDLRAMLGIVSNDLQSACSKKISGMDMVLSGFFSSIGICRHRVTQKMKKKASEIMRFLEISHLKNRNMNEMSSGEARRFLIGRALVHDPKALVLDEPTNSLDLHALQKFRNILSKIAGMGTSIIIVTHNIQDIVPEIKRVVLMKNGKFYKDGAKKDILTSQNISELFTAKVRIKKIGEYYYSLDR